MDEAVKGNESVIDNFVITRASLLTNGPALGKDTIRAGTEKKPAVGYTISRDDVGGWIFERYIDSGEERAKWLGEKAIITY